MDFKSLTLIAEIGSVHDGSFGNAKNLIEAASSAGAICVKFQTHIASAETLALAPNPPYFQDESRTEYFDRTSFTLDKWKQLKQHARQFNVYFISSPFSLESVDLLEEVGVEVFKVPSGEVTNHPLLEKLARLGKPVILSTGMSCWNEIESAVNILIDNAPLCIMQCTSMYPTPAKFVGLNNLLDFKNKFPAVSIGFSDHTLGLSASISAVALGATVIEKHFTFSRLMYGSDAKNSMEPSEFLQLSNELQFAFEIIKNPVSKDSLALNQLSSMKLTFQKSIVASRDLCSGDIISLDDLAFKKPGGGICASKYQLLIGKKLKMSVQLDHMFSLCDFQ
ncbi:MAG: N-acetylneuraminate synthase family protein [Cyanobium usitatum Tobar12.5m-G36]|nr:N-acetylneuraminate synthase family protein [Cyanobium usitatum Tobar12.5m-G36]